MIKIKNKSKCCGCSACAQRCPKGCINMIEDEEGFLYPQVDFKYCTNCGLCEKVCPVINVKFPKDKLLSTYVALAQDEELRMKSSSGGIFSLCAEWILESDGVVFGAAFDKDFMVHHIAVTDITDLDLLRGSKYLQSRIENTYKEAKAFLDKGKKVLYTGTECQISGLINFLGHTYDNLYTIDVLCHGVPSPKVWEKYLREQEKTHDGAVRRTFFRHKEYGWKTYAVELYFDNSTAYKEIFTKDFFMQMFLRNICLRPSCYECQFKKLDRSSDLSIGDCWGIENYMPEMDDDKGISVVLVHSAKGKGMFSAINNQLKFKEADIDKALPENSDSRKSVNQHPKRREFFEKLNKGKSLEALIKLMEPSLARRVLRKIKEIMRKIVIKMYKTER